MAETKRKSPWRTLGFLAAAVLVSFLVYRIYHFQPIVLRGAITSKSTDAHKELPIARASVEAIIGSQKFLTYTDSSGFFSIKLPREVRHGRSITFHLRHLDYQPLDLKDFVGDQLYVLHLTPLHPPTTLASNPNAVTVGNVRFRYSIKSSTTASVGSAVRSFDVENMGNVPCTGQPCSPDGRWKAAVGSATLSAGTGNEFRNVRVSCIAGPCPFTRIETEGYTRESPTVTATARTWSDTATFLVEAEVVHPMISDVVHESYPTIFGPTLNFILPIGAEGISLEADLNGQTIVFPLGPDLYLSWASCNARVNPDQTRVYRCELKPGYRF
jgi:hypothetical protein